MITIKKSPTADSRTCDYANVSKATLLDSSYQHIEDVMRGMNYIIALMEGARDTHDYTKINNIDMFYKDFKSNFETQDWWKLHKSEERHHISQPDGVRDDIDLVDVIEFIVDGVMAGMARSGKYKKEPLPDGLLEKAFDNTVNKLLRVVRVEQ